MVVGPVLTAVDSYNQGTWFLLGVLRTAQYAVRILYSLVIQVRNNVVKGKGVCAFKFDPFPIIQSGSGYGTKTEQEPGQVDHESNFFTSSYPKVTCPSSFSSFAGLSSTS